MQGPARLRVDAPLSRPRGIPPAGRPASYHSPWPGADGLSGGSTLAGRLSRLPGRGLGLRQFRQRAGTELQAGRPNAGGWGYGLVPPAQHGQPGQYTGLVIAESERTGTWEPLNVQLGFPRGSNTVTVLGVMGSMNIPGKTFEHPGAAIPPSTAAWSGDRAAWQRRVAGVLLMTPMRALDLSSQGITKADIQRALYQYSRVPRDQFLRLMGLEQPKPTGLAAWLLETTPADEPIPLASSPEKFLVVAAGGWCSCVQSAWLNTDQWMNYPVTVEIEKPARWAELLANR